MASVRSPFCHTPWLVGALMICSVAASPMVSASARTTAAPSPVHTVKAGETLTGIASRYQTTVSALADANKLTKHNHIVIGQQLKVVIPESWLGVPIRLRAHPQRLSLLPTFEKWAKANSIPADLLKATTYLESGWDNSRVSSTGAVGIGQLMPDTAAFIQRDLIGVNLNPRHPEDNIRMSARYLRFLLKGAKGDTKLALMRYYQGIGSLQRNGTYPQTRQYAADVLALRRQFVKR